MDEATKIAERHSNNRFIKDDKNTVHVSSKLWEFKANCLIDTATDAVAANGGFENLFRYDNTETLMMFSIGSKNKRKSRCTNSLSLLISVADTTTRMKTIFT